MHVPVSLLLSEKYQVFFLVQMCLPIACIQQITTQDGPAQRATQLNDDAESELGEEINETYDSDNERDMNTSDFNHESLEVSLLLRYRNGLYNCCYCY